MTVTVPTSALGLVSVGRELLAAVEMRFGALGLPLPSRRYLTVGAPANDCEQVVVSWQQVYQGVPGDEAAAPQRCDVPKSAVYTVQIARAIPVVNNAGKSPSAADIQTASEWLLIDAWVLIETLVNVDPFGLGTIVTCEFAEVSGGLGSVLAQTVLAIP